MAQNLVAARSRGLDAKVWRLDAKHEALRATVWALRARLGRFGLGGFGVAGASEHIAFRFNGRGSQRQGKHGMSEIVPDIFPRGTNAGRAYESLSRMFGISSFVPLILAIRSSSLAITKPSRS